MDGVLNSVDFFDAEVEDKTVPEPGSDDWWTRMVDPAAVKRLNTIVERSGAKIVISSSWRYLCGPQDMQRILSAKGFKGEVIGRTPLSTEMPQGLREKELRGLEIEVWLVKNRHLEIESFVILDDMGEGAFAHTARYLVRTSWGRGLLEEHVPRATEMLTRGADTPSPPRELP
jgi:hypothetical protein